MTSQLKIDTCRINGAKSHGPITPEGKEISARNSLRHGLLSRSVVLEGEDPALFDQLLERLIAQMSPATETDWQLVENLAVTRWRQLRLWALEKATIEIELENHQHPTPPTPVKRTAKSFDALSNNSRTLDVLTRYETRFDRQYHRALKHLSAKTEILPNEPKL